MKNAKWLITRLSIEELELIRKHRSLRTAEMDRIMSMSPRARRIFGRIRLINSDEQS